jgi:hypothetical protein
VTGLRLRGPSARFASLGMTAPKGGSRAPSRDGFRSGEGPQLSSAGALDPPYAATRRFCLTNDPWNDCSKRPTQLMGKC